MTHFKKTAGIISMLVIIAAILAGCSDSFSPVNSMHDTDSPGNALTPKYREVTFELGLSMPPSGEHIVSAEELDLVEFTAFEIGSVTDNSNADQADYCRDFKIETDYPGDVDYVDCKGENMKFQNIIIKNTGKSWKYLILSLKGMSQYGVTEATE